MPFSPRFFFVSRRSWQRFGMALLAISILLGTEPCQAEEHGNGPPRFASTFVQLWDRHNDWTAGQWDRLCADLAELGVGEIILQWSLITEPAFFWRLTPERRAEVPQDRVDPARAVDQLVAAAKRHGLQVRFGLSEDPAWWAEIRNEAKLVEVFLNRLAQDQLSLARTLVDLYGDDPVFGGFYIPQEIDDQTWLDPDRRSHLMGHLNRLTIGLFELHPGADTAISSFATGRDDPQGFAGLMAGMVCNGGVDFILYQDGLGTERLRDWESTAYLQAMIPAVADLGGRVRVVVETFAPAPMTPRIEGDAQAQNFVPAPMSRIARQLAQAAALTDTGIIAFSIPDYVHPLAGSEGERLFQDYVEYLAAGQ